MNKLPDSSMEVPESEGLGDAELRKAKEKWRRSYDAYVEDLEDPLMEAPWRPFRLDEMPSGKVMLKADAEGRRALLFIALEDYQCATEARRADGEDNWREWSVRFRIRDKLISHILDGGIQLSAPDILKLLPMADTMFWPGSKLIDGSCSVVERYLAAHPPTEKMLEMLKYLRLKHVGHGSDREPSCRHRRPTDPHGENPRTGRPYSGHRGHL